MLVVIQWMLSGWCLKDWEQNRNQNTGHFPPFGELSPSVPIGKNCVTSSAAFFWSLHCAFLSTEQHRCNKKNEEVFISFHTFVSLSCELERESPYPTEMRRAETWSSPPFPTSLLSRTSVDLSSATHFLYLKMQEVLAAPTDTFADT